jgi:hypothetical protein
VTNFDLPAPPQIYDNADPDPDPDPDGDPDPSPPPSPQPEDLNLSPTALPDDSMHSEISGDDLADYQQDEEVSDIDITDINDEIAMVLEEGANADPDFGGIYFIDEARRVMDELLALNSAPLSLPLTYRFRRGDGSLFTRDLTLKNFLFDPIQKPYPHNPARILGTEKLPYPMSFYKDNGDLEEVTAGITLIRSRPHWRLYISTMTIPCRAPENKLNWRHLLNPTWLTEKIAVLFQDILKHNIDIVDFTSNGNIRFWFQFMVEKKYSLNPKELNKVVLTTEALVCPIEAGLYIVRATLFVMAFVQWKLDTTGETEYFRLIDDGEDWGHLSQISLYVYRPPLREGGCRNFFGNRYVSNRLKPYIYDPETSYNNCLFACLTKSLNLKVTNERCQKLRIKLGFRSGEKIAISDLGKITDELALKICVYIISKKGERKEIIKEVEYGSGMVVNLLYNCYHFCLIQNLEKALEFIQCKSCYEWFNSTTERGMNHLKTCKKCTLCGLKYTVKHKCRSPGKKRKFVKNKPKLDDKLRGLGNAYSADFETLMVDGEMRVYAAGIGRVKKIKEDPHQKGAVEIWIGQYALDYFCNYLLSIGGNNPVLLIFHNGSRFDFYFIWRWLMKKRIPIKKFLRDEGSGKILTIEFANIKLWDFCLYTLYSLKKCCEDFKIPAEFKKGDFDHKKIKTYEDVPFHAQEVFEYLKLDVISLALCYDIFIQKIWDLYQYNVYGTLTLSNLAYDIWRSKFISPENLSHVKIPTPQEYFFLRRGLFGGRCSPQRKAFKSIEYIPWDELTKKDLDTQKQIFDDCGDYLVYTDCVSQYPWVATQDMPIGSPRFRNDLYIMDCILRKGESITDEEKDLLFRSYIEVDFESPDDIFTCYLFTRDDKGNAQAKLGKFEKQVYDGESIYEAMIIGYKFFKCHTWLYYPSKGPVLQAFMSHAFNEKAKAPDDSVDRMLHKLLMNSETGKHSQHMIEFEQSIEYSDEFLSDEERVAKFKKIEYLHDEKDDFQGFYVEQYIENPQPTKTSNIGVSILAKARKDISEVLRSVNGYRNPQAIPYYGDTDSLIFHANIYNDFKDNGRFGKDWGKMKNEFPASKIVRAFFLAPKTYAMELWSWNTDPKKGVIGIMSSWHIRAKGIPRSETVTTAEKFSKVQKLTDHKTYDLQELTYSLISRDGKLISIYSGLSIDYFESMALHNHYVIAHFSTLKKFLVDEKSWAASVKLITNLHRSINENDWWKCGKRYLEYDHGPSYPFGHYSYRPTLET